MNEETANFKIITDSTSDMNPELLKIYDIDYVKMSFSSPDKQYNASLSWDEMSPTEFYGNMRNNVAFTTTQVLTPQFIEKFRFYLEQNTDILYIGCSSALSGSVNTSFVIRDMLKPEFPNKKIICIDSLLSGMGQGAMVIKAAEMKNDGKSIDEVADWIEQHKMKYNQCGTCESLSYLKRCGRVTASSAFFGNLFAVKPILISDTKGQNVAIKKVKGRKNSLQAMADYVKQYIEQPENQTIYINHADSLADAELLKTMINAHFPSTPVEIDTIGPIVGASVGPGTVVVYYYGAEKASQM